MTNTTMKPTNNPRQTVLYRASQFFILVQRQIKLLTSDRISMMIMLGQSPIMLLILYLVSNENSFKAYEYSRQILFSISCIIIMMGIINSFLEVCKDREILKREYYSNLGLIPYMLSKIFTIGLISIFQGIILAEGSRMIIDFPDPYLIFNTGMDYFITIVITLIGASSMGLFVSSISSTPERATFLMPFIIISQIVFSGVIFQLENIAKIVSNGIVCRWAMSAFGSIFDINSLPLKVSLLNPAITVNAQELDSKYKHITSNITNAWIFTLVITIVCIFFSVIALSRNLKKH